MITIGKHIRKEVCPQKGIDINAVNAVLQQLGGGTYHIRTHGLGKCRDCGTEKHEHNGYGVRVGGRLWSLGIVVCPKCQIATTCYLANGEGCTPIRPDQWANGQRQYRRSCGDCGKRFTITARTWEQLHNQTNHRCRGNILTDLIAEEHKHLRGEYNPRGWKPKG